MKIKSLILLITIILIIGLVGIPTIYRIIEETKFPSFGKPFVGPGDCKSQGECEAYCEQNPEICEEYRKEEIRPGEMFIKSAEECERYWFECKTFCKVPENLKSCRIFCKENLKLCELLPEENLTAEFVKKPNLTLSYYKGAIINFHPGVYPNYPLTLMIEDIKDLKANIIDVWIETNPKYFKGVEKSDLEANFEYQKIRRAKLIDIAHKNGLQVNLRPACLKNEAGEALSLTEFLVCMREEAKAAQELDVYQLTLFGEIDSMLTEEKIQEYVTEGLKEAKKYYNGRIGIGFCCAVYEYDHNVSGYDFLLRSVYISSDKDLDNWMFNISGDQINLFDKINTVRQLANNSGVKEVIVGETGVCNPNKKDPDGKDECYYMSTLPLDAEGETNYYEKLFERTHDLVDGYFVFYFFPIMSVKGEPAEEVMKEWYGKL